MTLQLETRMLEDSIKIMLNICLQLSPVIILVILTFNSIQTSSIILQLSISDPDINYSVELY